MIRKSGDKPLTNPVMIIGRRPRRSRPTAPTEFIREATVLYTALIRSGIDPVTPSDGNRFTIKEYTTLIPVDWPRTTSAQAKMILFLVEGLLRRSTKLTSYSTSVWSCA